MRKVVSLVLCLLMLVAVFAGCSNTTNDDGSSSGGSSSGGSSSGGSSSGGSSSGGSSSGSAEGTPVGNGTLTLTDDPVEVTFWITVNDADDMSDDTAKMWHQIKDEFEAIYPNVTVKLEGVGSDASENTAVWNTAAAANNLPELVYTVDGYITTWEDSGVVLNYADYLSDDFKAAYAGVALQNANAFAKTEGAVFNSPCCQEVEGWIFNTKILDKYNLEVPSTIDEFIDTCNTLTANGEVALAHGGADTWAIWGYHEFTNQYGWTEEQCQKFEANEIDVRQSAFYKAFEICYTLAQGGCFLPDVATTKNDTAGAQWVSGQAAIWQIYDGYRHSQMKTYDTDPEAYADYYEPLMYGEFRLGLETDDDIFADGEVHGIKMNNWGIYIGSCAEKDPQKLAACVAWLEYVVSEPAYHNWVEVSSSIPLTWTSDEAYDYSMWGLEQSYYEAYALDGTFFHEPTDWFQKSITDDYRNAITGLLCGTLDVDGACDIFDTWQIANAG